jgi:hypothetical protein
LLLLVLLVLLLMLLVRLMLGWVRGARRAGGGVRLLRLVDRRRG